MIICPNCGSQSGDYAAQCSVCGTMLASPAQQAMYAATPAPAFVPEQRSYTSIGMWLLYMILGPIGWIIILLSSKDKSAKNSVMVDVILSVIGFGICLLIAGLMAAFT